VDHRHTQGRATSVQAVVRLHGAPPLASLGLRLMKLLTLVVTAILAASPVKAQLVQRNQLGITMGHVHLTVKDVDAQKHFWIDLIGGKLVKNGPLELIQFPGVYIMLRQGEASGPPAGTIVNHFGFTVKDMPGSLAKWKEAGMKIDPTEN